MNKEEIIEKFCELSYEVNVHLEHKYASDCFCYASKMDNKYYRFEPEVFQFIQEAVRAKMGESK